MKAILQQTLRKEDEGGGEGKEQERFQEVKALKEAKYKDNYQSNLELQLGISSSNSSSCSVFKENKALITTCTNEQARSATVIQGLNIPGLLMMTNLLSTIDRKRTNGLEPWLFPDPTSGFIDPWSLAARQQKAVLEQAHQKTINPSSASQALPRETQLPPPSAVGWPPICTFRRNMVSPHIGKTEMGGEREAKRQKIGDGEASKSVIEVKSAIFVKVNMEGYGVGRKIDLKVHDSYDSLSTSLKKMFKNFLSLDYTNSEEQKGETPRDYLLLYEDHEGDRMLVGDVPWEMFLNSVKRLYIVRSPKSQPPSQVCVTPPACS